MRWEGRRGSLNVEDRRGFGGGRMVAGGGLGALVIYVLFTLLGADPTQLVGTGNPQAVPAGQEKLAEFTSVVLADTEDVWTELFQKMGRTYVKPKLVLFSGGVDSACGFAESAVGPFYCPSDSRVYIDLAFYAALERQLGAHGDFAQAYVIAHEVGHHVQHLLGTM